MADQSRMRPPARAVIFDLDGVITSTASVHAAAWKAMFDEYLAKRAASRGETFRPFDPDSDYRVYVDGKPRYDGAADFLASRGIELPRGTPADPADRETVCGLGNRKDEYFLRRLESDGADVFPGTLALIERLDARGVPMAVVSSSRNTRRILSAAGVGRQFDAIVDGVDADELGLPGKPDPAVFLEAARRLAVDPAASVVIEDAIAGVEAGQRGGFGFVVGVDRTGHAAELRAAGADLVVRDLSELDLLALGLVP